MKAIVQKLGPSYQFLQSDPHLGDKIMILAYGGSYAYGTNIPTSDIDIRGCALNTPEEILGRSKYEQYIDQKTDTVIYRFKKMIELLLSCNPNAIEILGCKPEHYLYISEEGQMLLDHAALFLSSERVFKAFGGYIRQQEKDMMHKLSYKKDDQCINKCAMHIVRLYFMAVDILEQGRVTTYRENNRDLLLSIRNGRFQNPDNTYQAEFFALIRMLESQMRYALRHTVLPQTPDFKKVEELMMEINKLALRKGKRKYEL